MNVGTDSASEVCGSSNNAVMVFCIEVLICTSGRITSVEKRYSQFEDLHKELKKCMKTPEFPPKRVLRFNSKILEQRRVGLQTYLQGVLQGPKIPKAVFRFLEVNLDTSGGSQESLDQLGQDLITHQPMVGFPADAFLQDNYQSTSILPDIIAEGVHLGLYTDTMDELVLR